MEKTSDWGYILMEKTSLVAMSNGGYRKESATPDNNLDTDFAENAAHVAARDAEIVRTGITKNLKPSQSKARRRMAKLSRRKNR